MTYKKQLSDPRWLTRRAARIILAGGKCERCQSTARINVHHKKYINDRMAWDYTDQDLEVLCRECHELEHGIEPAPKKIKAVKMPVKTVEELSEEYWELEAKIQASKAEYFRLEYGVMENRALLDGCEEIEQPWPPPELIELVRGWKAEEAVNLKRRYSAAMAQAKLLFGYKKANGAG